MEIIDYTAAEAVSPYDGNEAFARRLYLSEAEVEIAYGLSRAFLRKRRLIGGGPVFVRAGRKIMYARADVEAWFAANRHTSTSDL